MLSSAEYRPISAEKDEAVLIGGGIVECTQKFRITLNLRPERKAAETGVFPGASMIDFFKKHYKLIIWIMIGTFLAGLLPAMFIR